VGQNGVGSRAEGSRFRLRPICLVRYAVGGQSGGADHADLQYARHEPPSQRDQQPSRPMLPAVVFLDGASWHTSRGNGGDQQLSTLLALPPYSRSSIRGERICTIWLSHWLAKSVFASWRNHGTLRRWSGTGSPPTTPGPAHSARSHRAPARPLIVVPEWCPTIERGPRQKNPSCPEISGDPITRKPQESETRLVALIRARAICTDRIERRWYKVCRDRRSPSGGRRGVGEPLDPELSPRRFSKAHYVLIGTVGPDNEESPGDGSRSIATSAETDRAAF